MKDFKFLNNPEERTYSTHLRAFLDEDEYSLRARMLGEPGGPERGWMIKKLLMEYLLIPNRLESEIFSWGTMSVIDVEMFYDLEEAPCLRGRVIVTEVNQPSYVENVAIYANEFLAFKQIISLQDEQ